MQTLLSLVSIPATFLCRDLASAALCTVVLVSVVQLHSDDEIEKVFVTAVGTTQALLTLHVSNVCAVCYNDWCAVRCALRVSAAFRSLNMTKS